MQIKTTVRYHFTSVRVSIIKKDHDEQMLTKVWRKANACLYTLVGM